ncbi:hypothetical protein ACFQH6_12655 [Halobacteriaceae archaeon GCM10025711]
MPCRPPTPPHAEGSRGTNLPRRGEVTGRGELGPPPATRHRRTGRNERGPVWPPDGAATRHRSDVTRRYPVPEYPDRELRVTVACPDCAATAVDRREVVEHRPCGSVRPLDAVQVDGGYRCPDCDVTGPAASPGFSVVGELYDCEACLARFDDPDYVVGVVAPATAERTAESPSPRQPRTLPGSER